MVIWSCTSVCQLCWFAFTSSFWRWRQRTPQSKPPLPLGYIRPRLRNKCTCPMNVHILIFKLPIYKRHAHFGLATSLVGIYSMNTVTKCLSEHVHGCPSLHWLYSVQFSCSVVSDSLWPHESQHTRFPCLSPTPGVHLDSHPSSQWCHPAISSSVVPFSSCPQSLPASVFPKSQPFAWGGQSTGVSALASLLPKKSRGWSPSECTGWISLQSKGLSRVFSNTTVQKHQFFSAQPSSKSNSHIHTWPQEKP